jgi:hypothetical protein
MAGICGKGGLFTSWQPGNKEEKRKGKGPDIPFKNTPTMT